MKVVILNGSPKGQNSISLQTALYFQKLHPTHDFQVLDVAQKIKFYEKKFDTIKDTLESADLLLFVYPVYTFLAPAQLHRFIELMKENKVSLENTFVSQITTSKHFYDSTAHAYIEENCYDFMGKYIPGFSGDMDDLVTKQGQVQARDYFDKMLFDIEHNIYTLKPVLKQEVPAYRSILEAKEKTIAKNVVMISDYQEGDDSLKAMMDDFVATSKANIRVVYLKDLRIDGGCLGCLQCAISAKCVYKDKFDSFIQEEIGHCDAIVYAFTIKNHFANSYMKLFDDRQFCNGHRSVHKGKSVTYIVSGDLDSEKNLQTVIQARSEVGGLYLCGIVSDQHHPSQSILNVCQTLDYVLEKPIERPTMFYGVGGTKIFRDLVYVMQGFMQADHKFYKENGIYDFPQQNKLQLYKMIFLGNLLQIPAVQKKMKGQLSSYILAPYKKVLEEEEK